MRHAAFYCWTMVGAGVLISIAAISARAAEPNGTPGNPPSNEQIAQWIVELDDDQFTVRQKATEQLIATGKPVIEAVTAAAQKGNLEVVARSIEVLRRLYESPDKTTRAAAEGALKTLAESNQEAASQRATAVLNPDTAQPAQPPQPNVRIQAIAPGNMQAIQIQVGAAPVARQAKFQDKDREIEINDDPAKGITIKITEQVDGKAKTTTHTAKDAADLKKQHPELYTMYVKHLPPARGAAIAGNIVVQAQGGAIAVAQAINGDEHKKTRAQLEEVEKRLNKLAERLKEELGRATDDRARKTLEQAIADAVAAAAETAEARQRLEP